MNIKPFDSLEYAVKATAYLGDAEKIELAQKLCGMVDDTALADALRVTCRQIMSHADQLSADAAPRRSDGSLISPYAPDGGPLRPRLGVVS